MPRKKNRQVSYLVIDIGNTALKAAWCDGITLGRTFRYQGERMMEFILSLTSKSKPEVMVLSSARTFSSGNIQKLKDECGRLVVIDEEILENHGIPSFITSDKFFIIIYFLICIKTFWFTIPFICVTIINSKTSFSNTTFYFRLSIILT